MKYKLAFLNVNVALGRRNSEILLETDKATSLSVACWVTHLEREVRQVLDNKLMGTVSLLEDQCQKETSTSPFHFIMKRCMNERELATFHVFPSISKVGTNGQIASMLSYALFPCEKCPESILAFSHSPLASLKAPSQTSSSVAPPEV